MRQRYKWAMMHTSGGLQVDFDHLGIFKIDVCRCTYSINRQQILFERDQVIIWSAFPMGWTVEQYIILILGALTDFR